MKRLAIFITLVLALAAQQANAGQAAEPRSAVSQTIRITLELLPERREVNQCAQSLLRNAGSVSDRRCTSSLEVVPLKRQGNTVTLQISPT